MTSLSPVAAHRDAIPHLRSLRIAFQNWPPDILFDVVYASSRVEIMGSSGFRTELRERWME